MVSSTNAVDCFERELHPIFKNDPRDHWQYIDKKVRITVSDGKEYDGWVFTIDPVSHNWILFVHGTDSTPHHTILVNNEFVTAVNILSSECPVEVQDLLNNCLSKPETRASGDTAIRKEELFKWFNLNKIPIIAQGEDLVLANGTLTIQPPYTTETMYSSNQTVLQRVRNLMQTIPKSSSH